MLLLLAALSGDMGKETINASSIARFFSEDWGFYHAVTDWA
jgi:hypothetical protein